LTLVDGNKMKLDIDPFPMNMNMINFEEYWVMVRTDQANTTRGKRVVVWDEPRQWMMVPKSPEPGEWKINQSMEWRPKVKNGMPGCCWKSMRVNSR
jgi:hypothetical protein